MLFLQIHAPYSLKNVEDTLPWSIACLLSPHVGSTSPVFWDTLAFLLAIHAKPCQTRDCLRFHPEVKAGSALGTPRTLLTDCRINNPQVSGQVRRMLLCNYLARATLSS